MSANEFLTLSDIQQQSDNLLKNLIINSNFFFSLPIFIKNFII